MFSRSSFAPTAPAAARAAPPLARWVQTGGRLLLRSQPAPADARLTPSLVVADFPAFVVVFPDGSRSLHPATPRERCTAVQTGYFNAASRVRYRLGSALLFLRRLFLQGLQRWLL